MTRFRCLDLVSVELRPRSEGRDEVVETARCVQVEVEGSGGWWIRLIRPLHTAPRSLLRVCIIV